MSGGIIEDAIYGKSSFSLTGTPTITDNTITLASGASIDVSALTAANITGVTFIPPDYIKETTVLTNASDSICGVFTKFLGSVPANKLWWIGLESGDGVLKTIEGTYSEETNTITVPNLPGSRDDLQNMVDGSAESGVKVEITGGGTINIGSTVSVPGGADVAIKPDSGKVVDIKVPGDTTAFDVSGGNLTLGGGGGDVTVDGGETDVPNGSNSLITVGTDGILNITTGATIQNNRLSAGDGGGIRVTGGDVKMDDGKIFNCQGKNFGGGVYITLGTFDMSGGTIESCFATHQTDATKGGGGVALAGTGTFDMSGNATIKNCQARRGGGVGVWGGTFNMRGGTVSDNVAKGSNTDNWGGGGIHIAGSNSTFKLTGGSITNNKVQDTYGNTKGGGISITGYFGATDTTSYPNFYCETSEIGNSITIAGNESLVAGGGTTLAEDEVYIKADVLYATTENGVTQALAADITTVDGLKNPQYN